MTTEKKISWAEGFVEAIEDFELKFSFLLAASMMSMEDGSSSVKVLNLKYASGTM